MVASSAATTYFNFWPVVVGAETLQMAGGGTAGFANPVYRIAVEMFEYDSFDPSTTRIVSLGTGYYKPPEPMPAPKGLVDTIELYPACDFRKFNPPLPSSIDETDLSTVPLLLQIGQAAAAQMDWKEILGL